jgi:hypothetical protein
VSCILKLNKLGDVGVFNFFNYYIYCLLTLQYNILGRVKKKSLHLYRNIQIDDVGALLPNEYVYRREKKNNLKLDVKTLDNIFGNQMEIIQ